MDIVVYVAPVKNSGASDVPDRQFLIRSTKAGSRHPFGDKAFQQSLHGNTLSPGLFRDASFSFRT
jgi:hypothetical protein